MSEHASPATDPHTRRIAEAAAWKVRLNEQGLESSYDFEMWLMADPANEEAWNQVEAPWQLFGDHAASPLVVKARRDALNRVHARSRPPRRVWFALAASILLVVCTGLILLGQGWWADDQQVYRTDHGERRTILLADGSRVSLDAETELRVSLKPKARELQLISGQARFDVAHDARRPFSVLAGGQSVVAVGTAFNIDLLEARPRITMIEGKVEIFSVARADGGRGTQTRLVALAAGQQLSFGTRAAVVRAANVDAAIAWNEGQLIFDDEPLATVAHRVSRYAAKPISVAPDAASLRVSGVFQSNDANGFVDTVTDYLPVRAERSADGSVTLVKAP